LDVQEKKKTKEKKTLNPTTSSGLNSLTIIGDNEYILKEEIMEEKFLTLEWENGDSVECEIIDRFEYEGKIYVVLNTEEDEESYIYILDEKNGDVELKNLEKPEFDKVTKYYFETYVETDPEKKR